MARDQLIKQSIVELVSLIKTKQVSPVEVVDAHLDQIEQFNSALNAIVTLSPDLLDQARASEAMLARENLLGPLHGIPLTIKDTIATAGIRTTSGSRRRENYLPAADATVVARLKAAGAIVLGKTNTSEMAIPYETDNPIFGRTNNPYNQSLTSGGSSGGEASAIAACLSPAGIGSDLSGSIRVPAHFCGIVGLKPTSGRIPMQGHVPAVHNALASGACIGPMARRVEDVSLLFSVLAGAQEFATAAERELKGLRVGWYDYDGVTPVSAETTLTVKAAVNALAGGGYEVFNERPPGVEHGFRLWVDLFSQASAADLQEFYSGAEDLAGPLARKILDPKERRSQSPEELQQALRERDERRGQLLRWMETTPLIVAPVGATPAFPHGTQRLNVTGETISVFRAFSYSQTFNVFDLPSVVLPAGRTAEGLPIGVQIIGRPSAETSILATAAIVETALGGWKSPDMSGES
ncbi:MAG: amidase [Pyrinomonadaceae bacterium]